MPYKHLVLGGSFIYSDNSRGACKYAGGYNTITSENNGSGGKMNSVLVLSAAAAAGHLRAADALVSVFKEKNIPARHVEVLQYTNPIFKKIYSDLYVELMTSQPDLLGWFYKALDRPWKFQRRRLALSRVNTGPLIKVFKQENPDLALCTHFLPAEILLDLS